MSKIIPYSTLLRQQHVSFLRHKNREYREREDYLMGLRKLLFQVEGQMRQAEIQQLEVFQEMAAHFKIDLKLPDLGDRVGLQETFATHPFLTAAERSFLPAGSPPRSAARKSWRSRMSPRRRDRSCEPPGIAGLITSKVSLSGGPKKITGRMGEVSGQSVKGENGI